MTNNPSGVLIHDKSEIVKLTVHLIVGYITHPNLVDTCQLPTRN